MREYTNTQAIIQANNHIHKYANKHAYVQTHKQANRQTNN